MLRRLLHILLLTLLCFTVKSQTLLPANLPSPNSPTSYYNIGWLRADSGIINAVRDTTMRPRYAGTQIMWQHAGVDTTMWFWDGRAWFTFPTGGGGGGISTFIFTPQNGLTGTVTNPTGPSVSLALGTSLNGIVNANGTEFGTVTIGSGLTYAGGTLSANTGTALNALISGNGTNFIATTIGAGLSYSTLTHTLTNTINNTNQLTNGAGFLTNITGFIMAGTNISITGAGTSGSPYVINASGGGSLTGGGNLSPLFNTSVVGSNLTFAFINPVADRIFGNPTGSTAAPIYFGTDATLHFPGNLLGVDTTIVASKFYAGGFYDSVTQVDDTTFTLNRPNGTKDTVQIILNNGTNVQTLNNGLTLTGSNGQWGGTLIQNTTISGAGFYSAFNGGRLESGQGAPVASTGNLTLGNDGNMFSITGNTQINAITTAGWQAGSMISFVFTSNPILKNNTAGGAGTAPMLLAGGIDYTAAAGDYIGFQYDGTNWHEITRKLAAQGGVYTFSNGLTESPATQVKLGGMLTQNTGINAGGFYVLLQGTTAPVNGGVLNVTNSLVGGAAIQTSVTTNGSGVVSSSTNGPAIEGLSITGIAVYGNASGTGVGVEGQSGGSPAAVFIDIPASTNTVIPVLSLIRSSTGTGANGIGGSITFSSATTSTALVSNTLASIWTNATFASVTSQFYITGVLNSVTNTLWTLDGNGNVTTTGGKIDNIVQVSATGTYNALANDFIIVFTGSTATLVYPTPVIGRRLMLVNQASGSITIPTTTIGNASTTTTMTTGQNFQVVYDGSIWRKIN